MNLRMSNIVFEFARVTEQAALAAYNFIGRGNKDDADEAAVKAMRYMLNRTNITGEIVIGEGELDEAPMLYIGEKVGAGGFECSIAVDPIEGTSNVANGRYNSIAVLAATNKGGMLKAPDMYMLKIAVGPEAKGKIDLTKSLTENVLNVSKALKKKPSEMSIGILDRPRHDGYVQELNKLGCRICRIYDGDVMLGVLTCMPDSPIDMLFGIGGAPEGVITAAALKALGGDMQGKLVYYNNVFNDDVCESITAREKEKLKELNLDDNKILKLEDLISGDDFIFSATGITKGDLLAGVIRNGNNATTETILIRGETQTIRKITSYHLLNKKDEYLREIFL